MSRPRLFAVSRVIAAVILASAGSQALAQAQQSQGALSVEDRERQNHRPEYISVGSFLIDPEVSARIAYDDNIFASDTDKTSDVYFKLEPSVSVRSNFSRHFLGASARFTRSEYAETGSESVSEYAAKAIGRFDITRETSLEATAGLDRIAENRRNIDSLREADDRPVYDLSRFSLAARHRFNRARLSLTGEYRDYAYQDANLNGVLLPGKTRSFDLMLLRANAGYEMHGSTIFVIQGEIQRRRYDLRFDAPPINGIAPRDRSVDGKRIEVGIERDVTELLSGTLRIGYLDLDYLDPGVRDVGNFSYFANLDWRITPLTNLSLNAERRLDETVSINTAGNLRDEFRFGIVHEFLRPLIAYGDLRYAWISPVGDAIGSREFSGELGVRYHLNAMIELSAELGHSARRSSQQSLRFSRNTFLFGISARF